MSGGGIPGFVEPNTTSSDANAVAFIFKALLSGVATSTLVQVKAVSPALGPASGNQALGTVSVNPLVQQVDALGNVVSHGIIYGLPYYWLQGGLSAVMLDPVVGDIGLAVFADHDITAVKAAKQVSPPGSFRRFDMADGMYLGAFPGLNPAVTQFVKFLAESGHPTGITITSPGTVTINGVTFDPSGNIHCPTAIVAVGEITAKEGGSSVALSTHKHSGVTVGAGQSGVPVPGT